MLERKAPSSLLTEGELPFWKDTFFLFFFLFFFTSHFKGKKKIIAWDKSKKRKRSRLRFRPFKIKIRFALWSCVKFRYTGDFRSRDGLCKWRIFFNVKPVYIKISTRLKCPFWLIFDSYERTRVIIYLTAPIPSCLWICVFWGNISPPFAAFGLGGGRHPLSKREGGMDHRRNGGKTWHEVFSHFHFSLFIFQE